jgi:hypothetical protein
MVRIALEKACHCVVDEYAMRGRRDPTSCYNSLYGQQVNVRMVSIAICPKGPHRPAYIVTQLYG